MIQPAGLGGSPAVGHFWTATVNASWTDSSARSMSPKTRTRTATDLPYSSRNTRSIAARSTIGTWRQPSGSSWNGRTSTGAPHAAAPPAAQSSAASRSSALITQNPPTYSLPSANGPSVISFSPPSDRTTVAVLRGCSPPANTQAPLCCSRSLNAATASYVGCNSSGDGGGVPSSTKHTLSRYCFIGISSLRGGPLHLAGPSTIHTNGPRRD